MDELFSPEDVLSEESKKLEKLHSVYQTAQSIILYSEEVDPTSASNLQVNKEMRDALDHLMRIYHHKLTSQNLDKHIIIENYEKAIGHLYRAAFDALDGTVMSLTDLISQALNNYSAEVLREVIPRYWEMRKEVLRIKEQVSKFRAHKDVGKKSDEMLNAYIGEVNVLDTIYLDILDIGPQLDEYAAHLRTRNIKKTLRDIGIGVIVAIVGGLILATLL